MEHAHVNAHTLRQILDRGQDPLAMRLLLHQVSVCAGCRERLHPLYELVTSGLLPDDGSFTALDLALAVSRYQAPALWAELSELPESEWSQRVQEDPRFASWGFVEHLCAMSRSTANGQPARALAMCELAEELAEVAHCDQLPESIRPELRMLAVAHRANVYRVLDDEQVAERLFRKAEAHWEVAEDEFLHYRPLVLALRTSLLVSKRLMDDAFETVREGLILARDLSTPRPELVAHLQILQAIVLAETGRVEEAGDVLADAARGIDPQQHPLLWTALRHNQVDCLTRLERYEEAAELMPEVEAFVADTGFEHTKVRLGWTWARIHQGLGRFEEAIGLYDAARQYFLEESMPFTYAIASLELASVFLELGYTQQVQRIAAEVLPTFQARDVHREVFAALSLFQSAAAVDKVSKEMVLDIAHYLRQARTNPKLRFEPGS
ncbi:MAG: hypothetical protein AAGD01_06945 [Acidobacteriota bacterium]